ncbi:MAG: TIGR00282 family metallophosphoesterase [Planctomycetes bacterium]|nr:TIGR00282 family metallophosphoesterase [Planctomycetota bacterium]
MNVLLVGDIVGKPGRRALRAVIPRLAAERAVDLVVVNGENAAQGSGITQRIYEEIVRCGVDVVTMGDHVWKRKEVPGVLEREERLLRPANFPAESVGRGAIVVPGRSGWPIGIISLIGRIFMPVSDCPFHRVEDELARVGAETRIIFVEIHAEATSEKIAMGWHLDGRVSCVFGTHTHVQTADERVLPGGTAYITDLGMTGPHDSVIGRSKSSVLHKFITQMHAPFTVASGDVILHGALVRVDAETGRARAIERIRVPIPDEAAENDGEDP